MKLQDYQLAQRHFALESAGVSALPELPTCANWPELPVTQAQKDLIVQTLLGSGVNPEHKVWLQVGTYGGAIAEAIITALQGKVADLFVQVIDTDFQNWLFAHADEAGVEAFGKAMADKVEPFDRRFMITPMTDDKPTVPAQPDKAKLYQAQLKHVREKSMRGEVHSTLTLLPTPKTANVDDIPFDDYVGLFVDMCDQPWDAIERGQLRLIDKLNAAGTIRLTNDDGTDIAMSLIDETGKHFTFANSLTKRNVPGSEAFSAPRRDSINGTIVAKGRFLAEHKGVGLVRDLTLKFENGQIVDFDAVEGKDEFESFLERDPNNRFVGELGIGTNPYLKRHVCNTLLVEKIGGSFHLALGDCYTMTDYLGTPVHMNNGNHTASGDHWDITTMLYGKGGKMFLDGVAIMEDGVFLDPELDILNRGWAALPDDQVPTRWKARKTAFT
jgi:aminopeptidase